MNLIHWVRLHTETCFLLLSDTSTKYINTYYWDFLEENIVCKLKLLTLSCGAIAWP